MSSAVRMTDGGPSSRARSSRPMRRSVTIRTKDGQIVTRKFNDVDNFIKTGESTMPSPRSSSKSLLPVHSFDIGLEAFYKEYEEPDVMNEKGMMYGVGLAYTYHDKVMFKAACLSHTAKWITKTPANWTVFLTSIGNCEVFSDMISSSIPRSTSPVFGLGYRALRDDSSGMITTTGARGYNRESNYWYSPVGVSIIKSFRKLDLRGGG